MEPAPIGKSLGCLTILAEVKPHITSGGGKKRKILCQCLCGNQTTVRLAEFLSGRSSSCGCFKRKLTHKRFVKTVDGNNSRSHALYSTWKGMKERCNNPNNVGFKYYGEKGIKVCSEWENSFETFVKDMGPKPSPEFMLERKNNDKGYSKSNVKWADKKEQMNHMRSNVVVEIDGVCMTVQRWAEKLGIPASRIRNRIHRGWDTVTAVTAPINAKRKN